MEEKNKTLEKEGQLEFPKPAKAEKVQMDSFWKQLRHFYRTGEKPTGIKTKSLKSIFEYLLSTKKSNYPYTIDQKKDIKLQIGNTVYLEILNYLLSKDLKVRREEFKENLFQLLTGLEKILKTDPEFKVDDMEKTYEFANTIMAFDKMAKIVSRKSGKGLDISEERTKRLKSTLNDLKSGLNIFQNRLGTIILSADLQQQISAEKVFTESEILIADVKDPFLHAMKIFDKKLKEYVQLIRAYRIASLEADGKYQSDIHGDYFTHFTRHRFLNEEESLIDPIFILIRHEELSQNINSFLHLLSSNQPIKVIILKDELVSKPLKEKSWEDAAHQFRQEISALAISQRNVFAFQSGIDDPEYLKKGITGLLKSSSPGIAQILTNQRNGKEELHLELKLKAASISRFYPKLIFDPLTSNQSTKMDLSANEQQDQKWPKYDLSIREKDGDKINLSLELSYADYKAIYPEKIQELLVIPVEFYSDNLSPLSEYLELDEKDVYGKIPFIYLIDENNVLQKAAVPNLWVVSCQERLDYWSFLQQFSDLKTTISRNENVKEDSEEEKNISQEIDYENRLKEIQENAIQIAAERMIKGLLGDDDILNDLMKKEGSEPEDIKKENVKKEDSEEITNDTAEDQGNNDLITEASIDTEDCTSCNECVDQFPNLFEYNDEKQAELKDPRKGSYEQLVKAAEKCPAECIHPGLPLNPNEANLEKLKKRAEKYN